MRGVYLVRRDGETGWDEHFVVVAATESEAREFAAEGAWPKLTPESAEAAGISAPEKATNYNGTLGIGLMSGQEGRLTGRTFHWVGSVSTRGVFDLKR